MTTPSELHRRETTTVHLAKTRYVYIARKYFKPPVQVTTNTVRQSVRKPVRPIRVLLLPATKIIPIRESVLSPQDTQSKLLKEDNFAFFFHDAFGCDIDTFIDLDKDDILSKFQSFFYTISEEMETLRLENKRLSSDSNLLNQELSDECNSLKQKLVVAKLALADKDI